MLAQSLELLAGVNLALLIGLDRIAAQIGVTLTGLAGVAALSWWLAPRYGIWGVGVAFVFDGVLVFVLSAWRLWASDRMAVHRAVGWLPVCVPILIAAVGFALTRYQVNTPAVIMIKGGVWALFTLTAAAMMASKRGNIQWRPNE